MPYIEKLPSNNIQLDNKSLIEEMKELIKSELQTNIQKFESSVVSLIENVNGNITELSD